MLAPGLLNNFSGCRNPIPKTTIFKRNRAKGTVSFHSQSDGVVVKGKGIEDVGISYREGREERDID